MQAPIAQSSNQVNEEVGITKSNGSTTRCFSIIVLVIYFIWGQGIVCGWWMWLIFVPLAIFVLINKCSILQWALGLFLLGVTFFAPPTLGLSEIQRGQFEQGIKDSYILEYGGSKEYAWQQHQDNSSIDISPVKRFYIKGLEYGLKHGDE